MRMLPNSVNTTLGIILLVGGMGAALAANPPADPIQTTTPKCVTPTNDMVIEGRRAYLRMNCYSCHGSNGHSGTMGPSLVGVEPAEVGDAVLNGEGGGMPSFKNNLCKDRNEIANLTAYIQSLGTGTEPDFLNWWEPGPLPPSH